MGGGLKGNARPRSRVHRRGMSTALPEDQKVQVDSQHAKEGQRHLQDAHEAQARKSLPR
ncbi:hypothetical protein TWF696_009310 [Orbilia brochopaga]|uniref:Uncharacterized protein n=1 Tax=Orbilia brochopaga TaxID=3140254 RepID=A0AAV9UKA2_9PEZI